MYDGFAAVADVAVAAAVAAVAAAAVVSKVFVFRNWKICRFRIS